MDAKRGDFVRVRNIIFEFNAKDKQSKTDEIKDLEMWIKGFLKNDEAQIGEIVEIETYSGKSIKGKLIEVNPCICDNGDKLVPEIFCVGRQVKDIAHGELMQ